MNRKLSRLGIDPEWSVDVSGDITLHSCHQAKTKILKLHSKDPEKPILMVITSGGGDETSLTIIEETVRLYDIQLYTLGWGKCQSAAFFALQMGIKRITTAWTSLMMHNGSISASDTYDGTIAFAEQCRKNLDRWVKLMAKRSKGKLTVPKIKNLMRTDCYLSAEKALEYKLVDLII
jgi:ATP-dependent protease ClpP protease subunit